MDFLNIWRHRELLWNLTHRDVMVRYRGSALGIFWALVQPLIMLGVYTFVFGMVFQSRWHDVAASKLEIATIFFSGLLVFQFFSECINRAPQLILENVNYVKRVVFPLNILPLIMIGSAFFHFIISIAVLFIFIVISKGTLYWTALLWPIIFMPFVLIILGFSWLLSSLGVFVRDITHSMGLITTTLLFLSPIFYPLSAVPPAFRMYFYLNPVTFEIEQFRRVVLWGELPNWSGLALYFAISLLLAYLGHAGFKKTRRGFADVL